MNNAKPVSNLNISNTAFNSNDRILIVTGPNQNTATSPIATVFSNCTVAINTLEILNNSTPANSTANVVSGSIWFDNNYIYVATANNVIKRAALSSF